MKTVTYNPLTHKIVPIEPDENMCRALFINLIHADNEKYVLRKVILAAPEYQERSQWISVKERLQSQAQQTESKQGCKECDGQTYMHSPTGEYLGECPYCTKEQEPYAYDVPTEDGTELAYAICYTKYHNPLPEGAIPLYLQSQAQPEAVGEVQHFAAPANLPAYVNVKWYGKPPKNGTKVYALPLAPEGDKP